MRNFILSSESTCDLSPSIIAKLDLKIVQMFYHIDGEEFGGDTGKSAQPKTYYDAMRQGKPTGTSMVNAQQAEGFFGELLKEGKDILHIAFASACSGTYECLKEVAERLNKQNKNKIYVVDSKCESGGQGLLLEVIAEQTQEMTAEKAYEYALKKRDEINHIFTVDDLKYLAQGGRISKSSSVIGNAFRIKPILYTADDGKLTVLKKVISRKMSLVTVANISIAKRTSSTDRYYVCHADCLGDAEFVADKIRQATGIVPTIGEIGFVIGSHSGPGTLAVFFLSTDRNPEV